MRTCVGYGELPPVPLGTEHRSPPRKPWGLGCDNIQPRRGGTVAHSFSRNHVYLVFSTRNRRNIIAKEWQPRLWAYLAGICKNHEMICPGGRRDGKPSIHLAAPASEAPSRRMKSSKIDHDTYEMARRECPRFDRFKLLGTGSRVQDRVPWLRRMPGSPGLD
jgi:hypothetical protein